MTAPSPAHAATPPRAKNPWLVLVALCLGFFMILLDTTIVNVALPAIIDKVGTSLDEALWVVNAYVLVYAVLLITAGRLGDVLGPRRLFLGGIVLFVLASVAAGLSQTPGELIAARAVQGVGGALLTPQTLAIIMTIFPPERRGAAFGIWGGVAGLATVAGPTVGGYLVSYWGWQWIFFVNVPIGVAALVLALAVVPALQPHRKHRLDLLGVLLATAGLTAVTFGLIEGERYHWGTISGVVSIPALLIAGAVVLVAFVVWQRVQRTEPLVPAAVFADRNFTVTTLVAAALTFGMLGYFLPLMIYLQSVLGLSALATGLLTAPSSVVSMLLAPVSGRLADRIGGKWLLLAGLILFAGGVAIVVGTAQPGTAPLTLLPGIIVSGVGMGLIFAPLQTVAMRNVPPQLAGAASGVQNTIRQLGGVLGAAAVGAVLQNRLAASLRDEAAARASGLPEPVRNRFVSGFDHAASSGLQVGAGQSGTAFPLPHGLPAQVVAQIRTVAHAVFTHAYVDAMHVTLLLPIAVLVLAAAACFAIRRRRATAPGTAVGEAAAPVAAASGRH